MPKGYSHSYRPSATGHMGTATAASHALPAKWAKPQLYANRDKPSGHSHSCKQHHSEVCLNHTLNCRYMDCVAALCRVYVNAIRRMIDAYFCVMLLAGVAVHTVGSCLCASVHTMNSNCCNKHTRGSSNVCNHRAACHMRQQVTDTSAPGNE